MREICIPKETRIIPVQFLYDPQFIPEIYHFGIPIDELRDEEVKKYTDLTNHLWQEKIGKSISTTLISTLQIDCSFLQESIICYIFRARIMTSPNLFIEGGSRPLWVWAIPSDKIWKHLPFYSRVIHELIHQHIPSLPEITVRKITHNVTSKCFGKEFADWFLERESRQIPS